MLVIRLRAMQFREVVDAMQPIALGESGNEETRKLRR
jgi:hypothetical protein